MNEDLKRYLDGELDASELSPDLKREAEVWDAFLVDARESGAAGAPVGLETRIMDAVRAERRPVGSRLVDWWVLPHVVRVRPMIGLAAAAAIAALLFVPGIGAGPGDSEGATELVQAGQEAVSVQFQLEAPDASTVALVGSFSGWEAEVALSDPDGDGIWSGRVMLPPGVHEYMFLVNGSELRTDPLAERYAEDGFGNRNAVIALPGGVGAEAGALAP